MERFLVGGEWRTGERALAVTDPYTGDVVGEVALASWSDMDDALDVATRAFERTRAQSAGERARVLLDAASLLRQRRDAFIDLIVAEGGKPKKYATSEVDRAISTLTWGGEEAKRLTGELIRLDTETTTAGRLGIARRFPVGPVLGIAPFNFPLNLVAHKVAPALGSGNPIVLKPAPATPLTALRLGALLVEAGVGDALSVVLTSNEDTERAVGDARAPIVTFTGSTPVGWHLKRVAPQKRMTLELGGNAPAIVEPDADIEHAAARVAMGGFYQAGQSCVSTQRVLVHQRVHDAFVDALVARVRALVVGDPRDPATDVGPLIDAAALDRVDAWVREALDGGARALAGAKREDPIYHPTVLTDVRADMSVSCREVFGPVVTVQSYASIEEAFALANDSEYGLQAGIFTRDVQTVFRAHRELRFGGVIHNDVSAFRADQMPYGGVKASGTGKEGLRYAMEEMTELRLLVLSDLDL